MATRSFLEPITIKGPTAAANFVKALESSMNAKPHNVVMSKPVEMISGEQIRKIFGVEDAEDKRIQDRDAE